MQSGALCSPLLKCSRLTAGRNSVRNLCGKSRTIIFSLKKHRPENAKKPTGDRKQKSLAERYNLFHFDDEQHGGACARRSVWGFSFFSRNLVDFQPTAVIVFY